MTPSNLATLMHHILPTKRPLFVWGPPGCGKSQITRQVAVKNGLDIIDLRMLLLDPTDLRGLPHVNGDNRAHWCPPDFLPKDGKGILFLDELSCCPPLVQSSALQLVLDRRIGEWELPDGWHVWAAGNREQDRSVFHRMPAPLLNRFVHVEVEPDVDDWAIWAHSHGIHPLIIAFLRVRPNLLLDMSNPTAKAFPTPRSWEYANDMFPMPEDVRYVALRGCIGDGTATELEAYLRTASGIPTEQDILTNPGGIPIPKDPSLLYALASLMASLAVRRDDVNQLNALVTLCLRLPKEFTILFCRDALKSGSKMATCSEFSKLAKMREVQELLI